MRIASSSDEENEGDGERLVGRLESRSWLEEGGVRGIAWLGEVCFYSFRSTSLCACRVVPRAKE